MARNEIPVFHRILYYSTFVYGSHVTMSAMNAGTILSTWCDVACVALCSQRVPASQAVLHLFHDDRVQMYSRHAIGIYIGIKKCNNAYLFHGILWFYHSIFVDDSPVTMTAISDEY